MTAAITAHHIIHMVCLSAVIAITLYLLSTTTNGLICKPIQIYGTAGKVVAWQRPGGYKMTLLMVCCCWNAKGIMPASEPRPAMR